MGTSPVQENFERGPDNEIDKRRPELVDAHEPQARLLQRLHERQRVDLERRGLLVRDRAEGRDRRPTARNDACEQETPPCDL